MQRVFIGSLLGNVLYPKVCITLLGLCDWQMTMDVVLGHIQDRGLDTDIPICSKPLKWVIGRDRINKLEEISIQITSLRD